MFNFFLKKIIKFWNKKFANMVKKNQFYYLTDKEYLNRNNLINKIIYDLKKCKFSITLKESVNNQQYNDLFDNYLNDLKDEHKKAIIKPLYEKILGKEDIINLNLAEEYFDKFNKNKLEVLEEYLCWRIYRYFFLDFLAAKLYE